MRLFKYMVSFTLLILCWSSICLYGALNGWWLTALAKQGDTNHFIKAVNQRFLSEAKGNLAFIVLENGRVVSKLFSPSIDKINGETLFPVASMSKLFTAYGISQLAQQGQIDLDAPIAKYLTPAWQLPSSSFDHNEITMRLLLSHTSGLVDGLGFADIPKEQTLPSLLESLQQPKSSRGNAKLEIGYAPSTEWQYSGGGYLIAEHIIENITGITFEAFMADAVFMPLKMNRANYQFIGAQTNIANAYDSEGNKSASYQYVSPAATGLLASADDLTQFVIALQQRNTNSEQAIKDLSQPLGYKLGAPIWGMGAMLYAPTPEGNFIFGHDGANEPAINSALRINPNTNDAIIVLSSGGDHLASRIASEWTLWQTGVPDFLNFDSAIASAFLPIGFGILVIFVSLVLFYRKSPPLISKSSDNRVLQY
ncbi:serine hydrolase domain-containing protein [Pseudoalteromonas sp.]|uniref:serine hydrolase domain-containing protein n=1 Tax=Pseudoalteromonas sp. TaxID=53249 RepID=UPI003565CCFC